MGRSWVPIVAAAGLLAAALGVLAPSAAAAGPAIAFDDQRTSGRIVLVDAVQLPEGGFVAIHDPSGGEGLGDVLGHSVLLGAGQHTNVPVTLDRNVTEPTTLIAALYKDANANQEFDLGDGHGHHDHQGTDRPYQDGEVPIGDRATVGPHSATAQHSSSWPTLGAGAAAALASLVFWAVRVR